MLLLFLLTVTPSDTLNYIVLNHGRPAGEMRVISGGDSAVVRFVYQDRQRGPKLETKYRFGSGGAVTHLEQRGVNADMVPGSVSEEWTAKPEGQGRFYIARSQTPYDQALLARHLLKQPNHTAALLPVGEGHAEVVADTTFTGPKGSRRARLVMLSGMDIGIDAIWIDEQDRVFASGAGWFLTLVRGWEGAEPALRRIEKTWREKQSADLAQRIKSARGTVVIRNGDLFDSETGTVRPRMTVVIEGDRIKAVGPADSVPVPGDATVFDATGKTIIPGLWDMHTHATLGAEEDGLMHLAAGVTTVRDMAADIDVATSRRERADKGIIIAPREILAGFIEGPGFWAGPSEVLVRTESEARAWVARYDSLGYKQIKLYNLVHPDLLPAISDEAKKRHMRLSGHIPRGLSIQAAVMLGYDEFQHSAFLFSTFYEDSLFVPKMRAYSQVAAAVAPTFNVDAPEVTALIAFLREKGTVVDGTFNLWQDRSKPLPDGNDPVFGPTIAWMPPLLRRGMEAGPASKPEDGARAQAASANYRRMLKRLFDAGVTLVPGTDNMPGLALQGELEVYERAGIPAPSVLQIATIVPARVMGDDKQYGSISVGKVADLAIVAGRPYEHVTDLRKTEVVVRAGRAYRTADLFAAVGLKP